MNISDVNATHRTEVIRNNSTGKSSQTGSSSGSSSSAEVRDAADRVEISENARAALKDARKADDLTFARKALDSVPEISEERIAELTDRIKSGYYQRADVLEQVARRAGGELASGL